MSLEMRFFVLHFSHEREQQHQEEVAVFIPQLRPSPTMGCVSLATQEGP